MEPLSSYKLGLSPCPNDTFIFYALLHGIIPFAFGEIKPRLADVEALNNWVSCGEPEFSKISVGVFSQIMDKYALLSAGAALGFGCGPLVVAKRPLSESELKSARVAVPGFRTTANVLLSLTGKFQGERREILFSEIMPAVAREEVEVGVIIHEGRFTYAEHGLVKILDLGAWWEENFKFPLPLGAIAVRRDVEFKVAKAMEEAIAKSLSYGLEHQSETLDFVQKHAQELTSSVIEAHIKTFVTDYSLDLGEAGRLAIERLVQESAKLEQKAWPKDGLFLKH
ncbi:MAG: 1,4-dihydroxy-6-naphthoate synthase [Desulfovibrionaceae bacterium]|nr:1,4-dihydroxy-6-naphthoate synthase [Desulfovibrionaceae bacterium]